MNPARGEDGATTKHTKGTKPEMEDKPEDETEGRHGTHCRRGRIKPRGRWGKLDVCAFCASLRLSQF